MPHNFFFKLEQETFNRAQIESFQEPRLRSMLQTVLDKNPFYRNKFRRAGFRKIPPVEDWLHFPFTTKAELVADAEAHPPYGSNLTYPLQSYVRLHQTSGTTGKPLVVLDTAESWERWKNCWGYIFRAAGVVPGDRVFVAFSFGPFVGFWPPFEAGPELGQCSLSGGGQTSRQRLKAIQDHQATVLVCTPSYALYLAEVAGEEGIDPSSTSIRITIHAGEPGASIPATKKRIEELWGAKCFDHIGASEVGPYGFECHLQPGGVHINELEYICEVIDPATTKTVSPGETGELVLTNLYRWCFPVIRYRTGDLVKLSSEETCSCGRSFRMLMGGILARTDDMMTIRGVNVYPSAVEAVVRKFREITEFEGHVFTRKGMQELQLHVEVAASIQEHSNLIKDRLENELRNDLSLRINVAIAPPGSLPRYELNARRFKRQPSE